MYCRFCGKSVLDDSDFCAYCGKSLSEKEEKIKNVSIKNDKASYQLQTFTKVICYIALVVFLILLFKMVPGMDFNIYYAIGAVLAILLIILFNKLENRTVKKKFYYLSIVVASFIMITFIVLRIIYEIKVDKANAHIPQNGEITVAVSLKEDFYSDHSGQVRNPNSSIMLNGELYKNGDVVTISLNNEYPIRINVSYDYEHGAVEKKICFTANNLIDGYSIVEDIPITSNVIGRVILNFKSQLDFWSVIAF